MTVVGKTLNEYAGEVITLSRKNRKRARIQEEIERLEENNEDRGT